MDGEGISAGEYGQRHGRTRVKHSPTRLHRILDELSPDPLSIIEDEEQWSFKNVESWHQISGSRFQLHVRKRKMADDCSHMQPQCA